MKRIAILLSLMLFSSTAQAALRASDCQAKSEKIKAPERVSFIKSCLEEASKPGNVKEIERKYKSALCEQNAKNMKLQGNNKAYYETNCLNKNEAAIAASAILNRTPPQGRKDLSEDSTPKNAAQKSVPKQHKNPSSKKKDS